MNKTLELLFKLEERYDFFRKLRGDKWQESVDAYEPFLRLHMEQDNCNEIQAALKLGKLLSEGGHDPNELFAVAVHMSKQSGNTSEHADKDRE